MRKLAFFVVVLALIGAGVVVAPHVLPEAKPYIAMLTEADPAEQPPAKEAPAPAATKPAAATLAPAVSVVKVAEADFTEMVSVSGSLVPRDEILVAPEVEGFRVLDLNVDEGDQVKKGDVLAILVQDSLDAQLAQNNASLARSEAAISQARNQIVDAKARVVEAEANFERAKPLKSSGYLSGSTYDQREAAAKSAAAQLRTAEDGLRVAEAEKAQVEAQRRELQWRRENAQVTAPSDGLISRRTARIGGMASGVGEPMFRIVARGEVELDAEVIETDLAKIAAGQQARINVAGVGEVGGKVRLVSPEVDKTTRLGRVRVFLGNDARLRIGSYGSGKIETARSHGLAIPTAAVIFDTTGAYVQLVDNGRVARRDVKTGLVARGLVEVKEGLAAGDIVVARSGSFLRDGDSVRPVLPDSKISEAR